MTPTPFDVPIWGFYGAITVADVAAALNTIAAGLTGAAHTIHVMSGTHGCCGGKPGAAATREQKFADEDRKLAAPQTQDKMTVAVAVYDFDTEKLTGPDYTSAAIANLNSDILELELKSPGKNTFLLAYCCSVIR